MLNAGRFNPCLIFVGNGRRIRDRLNENIFIFFRKLLMLLYDKTFFMVAINHALMLARVFVAASTLV